MSIFQLIGYFIVAVLIVGTIFVVIMENRNPFKAIAWLLVLTLLPVVGLVLYYFLGQDSRKMKKTSVRYYRKIKDLSFQGLVPDNRITLDPDYVNLVGLLAKSNHSPLLQGSKVEMITKGEDKITSLLRDMDQAKHHIHMEYFIFNNDETGKAIRDMLMKKASEGIEVRFIYDNVANWTVPSKFYREMENAGVQVTSFMKVRFTGTKSRLNFRNHRKLVIIDGHIGYTGGMNIANDYVKPTWRDTHLRIEGQGALGLQSSFLIDWFSSGETLDNMPDYFPEQPIYNAGLMQIVNDGPDKSYRAIEYAFNHIVTTADRYVYIQTPYFLPTDSMLQAMESAALSGIDIRMITSKRSDSPYVDPAGRSYYKSLLKAGMRIYEHPTKFIHAKTLVSDDRMSVIGSANLDNRSIETNFEINAYIYDSDVAFSNKQIFFDDMAECEELYYEEWIKRPRYKQLFESVMRLFSPLM